MGILGLALVFGLMVSGCLTEPDDGSGNPIPNNPNTPENPDNPGNPNDPPNSSKNIAVYMEKPTTWSQVYAYVWDDGGTEYTGSGSGTVLTGQSGGYYSFQAKDVENGYINVRFNDGGSHSSLDILDVETDTYYKSAGAFSGDNTKITLTASTSGSFTAPALTAVPATTEEFIFPQSTYKYTVEVRADDKGDGPLYGKWSSEISVTTPPGGFHECPCLRRRAIKSRSKGEIADTTAARAYPYVAVQR
jgi:hypothetical protein